MKKKTPYYLAGIIIVIGLFYGLYVCSNIDQQIPGEHNTVTNSLADENDIFAKILTQEYTTCFQKETYYPDSRLVSCELSGVTYYKNRLFFISDQIMPGHSSLFSVSYRIPLNARYGTFLGGDNIRLARKFKDIAISPELDYMFLTTSFEENRPDNEFSFLMNNMLFYIPINSMDSAHIAPDKAKKKNEIYRLRDNIKQALKSKLYPFGPEYFKVDGLAVTPDSSILLGISRIGRSLKESRPVAVILKVKYYMAKNDRLIFKSDFEEIYRMDFDNYNSIEKGLFISSMEYDYFNKTLYFTTAYHNGNKSRDIGGYLWRISLKDMYLHKPSQLIYVAAKVPLHFAHKPAGITVTDEETVFVICDDERISGTEQILDSRKDFNRQLNQAAYYVIEF